MLLKGSFVFLPDGSGYGSLVEYKEGQAQAPIPLKFELDGTTYVDGVAVTDEAGKGEEDGEGNASGENAAGGTNG